MNNITIFKCHDDGKGKYQSVKVWHDDELFSNVEPGYGTTLNEAKDNYINNFRKYKETIVNSFNNISIIKIIDVDCFGDPIDK